MNYLKNPGFELGDRDWTKGTGASIVNDPANANSGNWCGKITGVIAGRLWQTALVQTRPGLKLTARGWYNGAAATAGYGVVRIVYFDKSQAQIVADLTATTVPAGRSGYFESALKDSVAIARTKFARFQFNTESTNTSSVWYVDDGSLTGDVVIDLPPEAIIASSRIIEIDMYAAFRPLVGPTKYTSVNAGMSDRWAGVWTLVPLQPSGDLGTVLAFLRRLGKTGLFFAYDPTRRTPKNGVVDGMVVDGSGQVGDEIAIRGAPANSTPLVAGDYIEVGAQYFRVLEDLETGPDGTGVIKVWPAIRTSPEDGEDIITDHPKMVARVTSEIDWVAREARPVEISFSWEERV